MFREQALDEGKPEKVVDKIVEGTLEKFYAEAALLDQVYVKDNEKKVGDLVERGDRQARRKHPRRALRAFQLGSEEVNV